jgi:post-segregation antitoxin (ccd killing protein)
MYSKEKRKFYNKKWRENNKEKISNYQKIWRSEHKDTHHFLI